MHLWPSDMKAIRFAADFGMFACPVHQQGLGTCMALDHLYARLLQKKGNCMYLLFDAKRWHFINIPV